MKNILLSTIIFLSIVFINFSCHGFSLDIERNNNLEKNIDLIIDLKKETIDRINTTSNIYIGIISLFITVFLSWTIYTSYTNSNLIKKQEKMLKEGEQEIKKYQEKIDNSIKDTNNLTKNLENSIYNSYARCHEMETIISDIRNKSENYFFQSIEKIPIMDFLSQGITLGIIKDAEYTIYNGRGIDVLFAFGILEISRQNWMSAYYFWNGILMYNTKNKIALFGAALCCYNNCCYDDNKNIQWLEKANNYMESLYNEKKSPELLWCLGYLKVKCSLLSGISELEKIKQLEQAGNFYRRALNKQYKSAWEIDLALTLKNRLKYCKNQNFKDCIIEEAKKLYKHAIIFEYNIEKIIKYHYYYGAFLHELANTILKKNLLQERSNLIKINAFLKEAEGEYKKSIEHINIYPPANFRLGIIKLQQSYLIDSSQDKQIYRKEGIKYFTYFSIYSNENDNLLYLLLGYIYFMDGNEEISKEYIEKCLDFIPTFFKEKEEDGLFFIREFLEDKNLI